MRKKQSFLLTILSSDDENSTFCGQVKIISTGKVTNFYTLEELNSLLASEMKPEQIAEERIPYRTDAQDQSKS